MYSDQQAFERAIIESPDDDTVRLIYADWLDEHGQPERAEFIRLQCELEASDAPTLGEIKGGDYQRGALEKRTRERELWCLPIVPSWFPPDLNITYGRKMFATTYGPPCGLIVRGFVAELRCTLGRFIGSECDACDGTGDYISDEEFFSHKCGLCNGFGYVGGLAQTLFDKHPIKRVVLLDVRPVRANHRMCYFMGNPGLLPDGFTPAQRGFFYRNPRLNHVFGSQYSSEESAVATVSDDLVNYARRLHGFEPLPRTVAEHQ